MQNRKRQLRRPQGNKQLDQYAKELDDADTYFGEAFKSLAYVNGTSELRSIPEIAADSEAVKVGQRLFLQNCSQCHGSDARGQKGFPNLADEAWLYGGEPQAIVTTVMQGRIGQMPGWEAALGEQGIKEVVSYTLSLSGRSVNAREAEAGKARFVVCAACHGTDGKGNPAVGAPDLTDQIWLFGGSRAAVTETVDKWSFRGNASLERYSRRRQGSTCFSIRLEPEQQRTISYTSITAPYPIYVEKGLSFL